MTKDRYWIYGSIESLEFIDGVLKFCSIDGEHQIRTGRVDFYFPCIKCGKYYKYRHKIEYKVLRLIFVYIVVLLLYLINIHVTQTLI